MIKTQIKDRFGKIKAHWDILIILFIIIVLVILMNVLTKPRAVIVTPTKDPVEQLRTEIIKTNEKIIIQKARDTLFIKELKIIENEKITKYLVIDSGDIVIQHSILSDYLRGYDN